MKYLFIMYYLCIILFAGEYIYFFIKNEKVIANHIRVSLKIISNI